MSAHVTAELTALPNVPCIMHASHSCQWPVPTAAPCKVSDFLHFSFFWPLYTTSRSSQTESVTKRLLVIVIGCCPVRVVSFQVYATVPALQTLLAALLVHTFWNLV